MDKFFVCMAVSFKYGGRCIGGVEVTKSGNDGNYSIVKSNGTPKWIRPVTRYSEHGEIPMQLSSSCHVLDIVKLTDVEAYPNQAQSENYYFSKIEKVGRISQTTKILDLFCDSMHNLVFGNRGKAVHPDSYETMGYSMMLVKASDVNFFMETRYGTDRKRLRVRFTYKGVSYELPVTDPESCEEADSDVDTLNGYENYYLTLSLGVEYEGWHSKLVANVIPMN